jgi:hypothetical protein
VRVADMADLESVALGTASTVVGARVTRWALHCSSMRRAPRSSSPVSGASGKVTAPKKSERRQARTQVVSYDGAKRRGRADLRQGYATDAMMPEDARRWLEGTPEEVLELQKPAPDEGMVMPPAQRKAAWRRGATLRLLQPGRRTQELDASQLRPRAACAQPGPAKMPSGSHHDSRAREMIVGTAMGGETPTGSTIAPKRALSKVLLPV